MSLSLDVYNKKKQSSKKQSYVLDRRRFKGGRSKEENLIEELRKDMESLEISNREDVIKDLLGLKEKLKYLNFYLLLNVYQYFARKNFDLSIVFLNFDNDFKEEYQRMLIDNPYTSDLKNNFCLHKFRQDYIIYLFLLAELELNTYSEGDGFENLEEDNILEEREDFEGTTDYQDVEYDDYQQDL